MFQQKETHKQLRGEIVIGNFYVKPLCAFGKEEGKKRENPG